MIQVTFNQNTIEYILLVLVRMSSFVFICPFFGYSSVPARVKVGLSVFVSILVFYSTPVQTLKYETVIDFSALVIMETITGLMIGFAAYICNSIILFSGKIIDMEIGLSMAQVFDPITQVQSSLTGTMYSTFIMLFMIVSNMHLYLLSALVDTYSLIPIGGIKFGVGMYTSLVGFVTNYFLIGFRIVLPVFAAILLLNCVLGIMAKVAPQMNMFAVGMQLKVLVGLGVMFATVSLLPIVSSFIFEQMKKMVKSMIRAML